MISTRKNIVAQKTNKRKEIRIFGGARRAGFQQGRPPGHSTPSGKAPRRGQTAPASPTRSPSSPVEIIDVEAPKRRRNHKPAVGGPEFARPLKCQCSPLTLATVSTCDPDHCRASPCYVKPTLRQSFFAAATGEYAQTSTCRGRHMRKPIALIGALLARRPAWLWRSKARPPLTGRKAGAPEYRLRR